MKVLIAGGGIGGLATALSLHAVGVECEVFEQSTTIRELGVGINVLPHAVKELAGLGLLDALDASRCAPVSWPTPTGSASRSGAAVAETVPERKQGGAEPTFGTPCVPSRNRREARRIVRGMATVRGGDRG